ncbi:hypothetical protein PC118_g18455 [Phytophthora cactorum]|uniref:Uncharacterized protein n=1 Tax=Phytophthora cactorum TaxID=29920 RepID=A0A8T1FA26_9STRA|nr:hypothetical protein PC111_g17810 [Phytophthora cactorum]KAG2967645.1 hypothetical protein PC118_g18455 [Phytophthora cactorum]KAG2986378.1 hypothetical protein PC119_g19929 [Phytophthora cactorum]
MKCITRHTPTNLRGYVEHELTKNKTDCKKCFDFAGTNEEGPANDKHLRLGNNENQWLSEETLPGFHNEMATYFGKMEFIARRLLHRVGHDVRDQVPRTLGVSMNVMLTLLQVEELSPRPELVLRRLKRLSELLLKLRVRAEARSVREPASKRPAPRSSAKT